jgi:hypothetical protein
MLYQLSYPRAPQILAGRKIGGEAAYYSHYTDGRSAVSALWGTAVKRTGGSVLGPK